MLKIRALVFLCGLALSVAANTEEVSRYFYPNSKKLRSARRTLDHAKALYQEGKVRSALMELEDFEKSYPEHIWMMEVHMFRGDILAASGNCGEAGLEYRKVLRSQTTKHKRKYRRSMHNEAKSKIMTCI
jgi:outer membrane protein assembly factor BamD (BamD/ComL family)